MHVLNDDQLNQISGGTDTMTGSNIPGVDTGAGEWNGDLSGTGGGGGGSMLEQNSTDDPNYYYRPAGYWP
jgi:bacteriocin-like protein